LPSFCAYETQNYHGLLPTPGIGKRIVEMGSAVSMCAAANVSPLNGDHQDIVKPVDDGKPNAHTLLRAWLRATAASSASADAMVMQYLSAPTPLDNSAQSQLSAPLTPIASSIGTGVGRPALGGFSLFDSWSSRCLWSETLPPLTGSFTVAAWVWPDGSVRTDTDPDRSEYIVGVQGSGPSGSFTLRRYDPRLSRNHVFLHVKTDAPSTAGATVEFPSPSLAITEAHWNFMVASYDLSSKRACISVDGSAFECATSTQAGTIRQVSRAKFTVGCITQDVGPGETPQVRQSFHGTISRVQVFNAALTRRQVGELLVEGAKVLAPTSAPR
jgi:hypothetical protein